MFSRLFSLKSRFLVAMLAGLVLLATAVAAAGASSPLRSLLAPAAPPPTLISYQGVVKVSGSPYTGTGNFQFAIVDAATGDGTILWSTTESLTVNNGLFDFMLGSTTPLPSDVFDGDPRYLRVWFDGTALEPNQRIGSAPYALRAERSLTADVAIGIGDNTNACTPALAGNLRWTGSAFEICDGSTWSAIQVGATKPIVLYQANNSVGVVGFQLGGRSGADSRCSSASSRPTGYARYRAFLSVSTSDEIRDMPSNYGVPTTVPVISNTSALLAQNWYDLLDGTIISTLVTAGVYMYGGPGVWWSGSTTTGALSSSCAGWTNGSLAATYGRVDQTGATWINSATAPCTAASNLLCIAY